MYRYLINNRKFLLTPKWFLKYVYKMLRPMAVRCYGQCFNNNKNKKTIIDLHYNGYLLRIASVIFECLHIILIYS